MQDSKTNMQRRGFINLLVKLFFPFFIYFNNGSLSL